MRYEVNLATLQEAMSILAVAAKSTNSTAQQSGSSAGE
jgi:hypothetical protein